MNVYTFKSTREGSIDWIEMTFPIFSSDFKC